MKCSKLIGFISLGFIGYGCSAGGPEGAPLSTADTIPASKETTNLTGVTVWEVGHDSTLQYDVIGLREDGEIAARISTELDSTSCRGNATAVTFRVSEPANGIQALGCDGTTLSDTLTPASRVALERLNTDLDAKNAGKTPPAAPPGIEPKFIVGGDDPGGGPFHCAPALCCAQTDTSCWGVVLFCNDQHSDCSHSGWHPCGACFGLPF